VANAFGDPTAARVALLDAAGLLAEVDAPYERAQATLLLARCLAGSGRREAAAVRAAETLQLAQALGARSLIGAARDLLAELGTASAPDLRGRRRPPARPGLAGAGGCVRRRARLRVGTHVPGPPAG
jgi:hypothetical protein